MKKFFSFIIKQSVAIVLAVVFVLAFGVYATLKMSVNLLPDINVPMVCVQVIYPGANATSVEKDVTVELEDGLSAISGVTEVESYSYDNLSAVVLSFDYGTDTTEKKTDIQNKLSALSLPDGVTTSVYDIDLNAEALAVLSVTSDEGETEDERLKSAYISANELASKIAAIDGVESVEIKGGAEQSYVIKPFGGLELIAPLIVQAFSYGQLDLPLGNISESDGDVQIRNNSDVERYEDILNTPVTLPSSVVTLLTSVKQIMRYYENATVEDLQKLETDLDGGVLTVLGEIDELSADDMDKLSELKTYMNIAATYTAQQLKDFKGSRAYKEISDRVAGKSDDELEDIAEDIKTAYPMFADYITTDMLKVVRDNKIDAVIAFREDLEGKPEYTELTADGSYYSLTDDDYYRLETAFVKVYSGVYDYSNPANITEQQQKEIKSNIDFAKKTSATGLNAIADKKREEGEPYNPTDAECALLFTGTELSSEHPVITSPTFIAFVRSPDYPVNMSLLIQKRGEFGNEITAEQYYALYGELKLDGVFEFKLSKELINLISEKDLTDLTGGGLVVNVGEIAKVDTEDEYSSYVYFGSGAATVVKGTVIEVYKSNGANSSSVVDEVKKIYGQFLSDGGSAAKGAKIALLDDQSEFISDSISNVLVSMLIGGALAIVIIFIFLKKVRTSLIIAITMPLSVLAALICLYIMGITLNMVSLGGLAVGIGMLVDNSIVVIESISKHRDRDKSAYDAAVDGTTEVAGALFGSTLTTVCVFIPIIFSGGLTGEIFTDLSWAVIFSLTFSLIVAVTVIPSLYSLFCGGKRMLKGGRLSKKKIVEAEVAEPVTDNCPRDIAQTSPKKSFKQKLISLKEPKLMNAITGFYGKILPKVLGKKIITIVTAVAVFGASIGLLFLTGTEFLPSIDKGQIEVNMSYGSGTDLNDVQSDVFAFAQTIQSEVENIDYVSVSAGKNGLLALTDTGIITVQLKTNRGTSKVVTKIREIAEDFDKERGNALGRSVTVKEIDGVVASLMSGADDMAVTIVGNDAQILRKIAAEVGEKLESAGFKDVKNSATDSAVEYDLKFDRRKMSELGLDYQTLILTLRIGIASYTACTVTLDGTEYNLNVRFNDDAVTSVSDLENFVVGADGENGGEAVKLKDICVVTRVETEACIRRTGGKEMISVSATLPGVDTGTAGKKLQKIAADVLDGNPEYSECSFESGGITSYLNDAFAGLAVALVISFFLLYAVMAVQFGSAKTPLIIMAGIPFSFTGGFIALVITGTSLNVVSFIGLIMLMGVIVNNAIVMLEKIKQLHSEGMDHLAAVQEACKVRLRPIFMTTLTTILALIPLAIGVGQGSELMQPLGIVVIGGLLIGTLVTLVLVPAVYCSVYRLGNKNSRRGAKNEETQSPAEAE